MDFAFNDEQQMLRDSAQDYLTRRFPLDRAIRSVEQDDPAEIVESFREMAGLGWTGLAVGEDSGGSGMGFLEEAVLFEELGYGLYPGPYFSTVALARPLAGKSDLERRIASGTTATLAFAEPGSLGGFDTGNAPSTKAEMVGDSWMLTGTKHLVPNLMQVDVVLVAAATAEGTGVWAVSTAGDGVTVRNDSTMDETRRLGRVVLDGAEAEVVIEPGCAGSALSHTRDRALAALAVEAVGICRRILELSVEHAREREQFERPIGAYQAVSQRVADTYMETELARSLAYWAAWCVDTDDETATRAASSAKAFAADAAVRSAERAIQLHGGIGFTWEHVLHRFYKRAQWIEAFGGYGQAHRAVVVASLLS